MKRKVIRQGNNTLTITLPRGWASRWGVAAGDELDLEEKGRQLVLGNQNSVALEKIQIDASKLNDRALCWILSAAHKSGYDEIEAFNLNSEKAAIISELVRDLFTGFSIVEQSPNRCLLRSISKEMESEFEVIFRRGFLVALSMADSTLQYLKEKETERMRELLPLEKTNNQLTNFCERVINKVGYHDVKKNCFYYVIAWNLEKVCDEYKYLCEYFPGKKTVVKPELIDLLAKTNRFFRGYYEIFYKFDMAGLAVLANDGKELIKLARAAGKDCKTEADFVVLSTILQILHRTADFSASFAAVNWMRE